MQNVIQKTEIKTSQIVSQGKRMPKQIKKGTLNMSLDSNNVYENNLN